MKVMLSLLVGLVVGTAAHSQGLKVPDSLLLQWKLQVPGPSPLSINGFLPDQAVEPGHMPCLVPDLARVERMPVRRAGNGDPMPNGLRRRRVWSMDVRPGGK